jgi:multiple sugar transport system permease protein
MKTRKKSSLSESGRETLTAMTFIAPWVIGFLAFTLIPICLSFYYSLCNYTVVFEPEFIGFGNYVTMWNDEVFWKALSNTMYMVFFGVIITTFIALLISLLLNNKKIKGSGAFRVVFFIPTLVPLVISCLLWVWILQGDGFINTVLRAIGISEPPVWLSSPFWAKPALILMLIWGCGNAVIIYLAGLQDIPESLYESASLDGATYVRKTISITLPMLTPVLLYNVVTLIIQVFQQFAEALIMTEGGPDRATLFYALYLYQNAFQYFKMGYASALSWVMLIIALIIIFILFKLMNKVSYE